MSDDCMEEDEEFDFQYSGSEEEEPLVDLENQYYESKTFKDKDPQKAITEFLKVVELEPEMGEWGFKSLKQCVKVSFKAQNYDQTLKYFSQLLLFTKTAVTRNVSEKSINSILDYVSQSQDMVFMEKFYATTLEALQEQKNDRLWTKTNLKLAKLWLDRKEFSRLTKIVRLLHNSCQNDDGTDDQQKGTLLQVY
jgi:COP9 signalosome complex subunit 2